MIQRMSSPSTTFAYQMPQSQLSVGSQIQQSNVNANMVVPILCPMVQVQTMLPNMQYFQPLQPQHIMYVTQTQAKVQNRMHMPNATSTAHCMIPTYTPQNVSEAQYVRNAASSVMSSPGFSCFSPPGHVNPYGCIRTPVLASASSTRIPNHMSYRDLPPRLQLHKKVHQACNLPQGMSCNINMGPETETAFLKEKPTSVINTQRKLPTKQPKCSGVRSVSRRADKTSFVEEEDLWPGNANYKEYFHYGSSNLFVTWPGSSELLREKMRVFKMQIQDVLSTCDKNVFNVIFESHPIARKAFTMQKEIGLRMVPPKNTRRIWLRNPSPKFVVKFEAKCRLEVRKGRAQCHDIVGELLEGSLFSADQLKGNCIRVVCCEGSFKFPGGKIVEMRGIPINSIEKVSLGWIFYRSKYTKESRVIRRSWNKLGDYVFKG